MDIFEPQININNKKLDEALYNIFEARSGKSGQIENIFERGFYELNGQQRSLDFGDKTEFFKKATVALMNLTKRGASKLPGNVPLTIDDIMYLIFDVAENPEFMKGISTPTQLAKELKSMIFDIIDIANNYTQFIRKESGYKGKLAYELEDSELKVLIASIKFVLDKIFEKTGKRLVLKGAHAYSNNESINDVFDYLLRKSVQLDVISDDPDVKLAMKHIKKYSGNERLVWPTLSDKLQSGDKYKSLYSYFNKVLKGEGRSEAQKIIDKYKNKTKQNIKKALHIDKKFRQQLKALVRSEQVDKTPGSHQTINNLQKLARQLMNAHPEYKAKLAAEGIKETALDEIVGMISQLIRIGGFEVQGA